MEIRRTRIKQYQSLFENIALAIVSTILFFSILEIGCRTLNLEVNTGKGPLREEGLLRFEVTNKGDQIDRDVFIETGPRIMYPLSEYSRSRFNNRSEGRTILSIGDSCAYGLGVNENQTFSYFLEGILNGENFDRKSRVFNFGWPGYASSQGVVFLRKYIKDIHPNIIIAWFGANDGCYAPFFSDGEYLRRKNSMVIKAHDYLYAHFRIYRILKNINLFYARRLVDRSFKNPVNGNYKRRRVSPEEFKRNLNEMKSIAKENNCKIIFIWHSWLLNGKLEKHAEYKPEIPYLDISNVYSLSGEKPAVFFADFCHPSAKGHEIIAQALKTIIAET